MANSVKVPDPLDKVLAYLNSAANRLFDAENIAAWNAAGVPGGTEIACRVVRTLTNNIIEGLAAQTKEVQG